MMEDLLLEGYDIHYGDVVICDLRRHVPWHRDKLEPVYQVYNKYNVWIFNNDFNAAINKFHELKMG